ncbi:exodeoxyribonuclease I [Stutzerimonas urumqiensis]|uniref:exodeoxyribonuclease I n=1 Tax=Stutzerimonas urumqiensis TaxID=638269 RepID=UPI003DA4BAF0
MAATIFWYDYETTGISPRRDRPLQVAGIRTDEALQEVGEPLNLYCRPSDDILPHPAACLVTGITPALLRERGVCEAVFMSRLHEVFSVPGTCVAGYNNLRFDDEMTRYSLYRNFFDPYGREWQGGNSRWDLIDLVRTTYALRPEGIRWPVDDGRPSLKLERLASENGLEHLQAHDALSDVRATIALARLIRDRQPRLYAYVYRLRHKHAVQQQIRLLEPLVHVSGRYAAERHYLAVALPLAWHPVNRNALIVCDLHSDPAPLLEEDPDELSRRLYLRRDALVPGELPVPLKLLHINRCPVIAPLSVLRPEDKERLGLDMDLYLARAQTLVAQQANWAPKLSELYRPGEGFETTDPEQQLYEGFLGDEDRLLCNRVRSEPGESLDCDRWKFADPRLAELLFRYKARNHPEHLTAAEQARWAAFCATRLNDPGAGAPNTLAAFEQAARALLATVSPAEQAMLQAWLEHARELKTRYRL